MLFHMNISEKIEEMRHQPEHIRIRYVWGCVAVSMFIVLAVWIFSIFSMFGETSTSSDQKTTASTEELKQQLQGFKDQTQTIQDLGNQPLGTASEGIGSTPPAAASLPPLPGSTNNSDVPQSDNYSSLPNASSPQQ
jgi:hypothetical protein